MNKYLKAHEEYIKQRLHEGAGKKKYDWAGLLVYHKTRIEFMQHERLIHLLVTLTVAILLFIAMSIACSRPSLEVLVVMALLLILLIPYIGHYFFLENGVQRWYKLYDEMEKRKKERAR